MSVRRARLCGALFRGFCAGVVHTAVWALGCHFFSHKFDSDLLPVLPLAAADCLLSYWILRRRGNPSFTGWLLSLPVWGFGMLRLLISPEAWRAYFFAWWPYSDLLDYYHNWAAEVITPLCLLGSGVTLWLLLRDGSYVYPISVPPKNACGRMLAAGSLWGLLSAAASYGFWSLGLYELFSPYDTLLRVALAVVLCVLTRKSNREEAIWTMAVGICVALALAALFHFPVVSELLLSGHRPYSYTGPYVTKTVWVALGAGWYYAILGAALWEVRQLFL